MYTITLLPFSLVLFLLLFSLPTFSCAGRCRSDWGSYSRRWIGPSWWASPLQEWRMRNGRAVSPAWNQRTLSLFSCDVITVPRPQRYTPYLMTIRSTIKLTTFPYASYDHRNMVGGGFRIGRKGINSHFLSDAIDAKHYLDIMYYANGTLQLGNTMGYKKPQVNRNGKRKLKVTYTLSVTAQILGVSLCVVTAKVDFLNDKNNNNNNDGFSISKLFSLSKVHGAVSMLTNGPMNDYYIGNDGRVIPAYVSFSDFSLSGDAVRNYGSTRDFGPVLWTQYTLSKGTLRILAHFAPLPRGTIAHLWTVVRHGDGRDTTSLPSRYNNYGYGGRKNRNIRHAISTIDHLSRTAIFTIPFWNVHKAHTYTVRVPWGNTLHSWAGVIRREPKMKSKLKIGVFSCDKGYMFPQDKLVSNIRTFHNPDLLFFAGDQIYESSVPFGVMRSNKKTQLAFYDFLRRFWRFGLTWRYVLRDRPSIILPDDHDVFQGNLWGAGGKKLAKKYALLRAWNYGGYYMSGRWVKSVERVHVGHLPPSPFSYMTLPIGIKPYFTSLDYAGISFAILEDRKFKTGPFSLPKHIRLFGNTNNAHLLGFAQESFLKSWGNSNSNSNNIKIALSQTIFAKANTHGSHNLYRYTLPFFDSGAWPIYASHRAVMLLKRAGAFSIHGDQHLGILLRRNNVPMFMVPGTANGWPRAFWPGFNGQKRPTLGKQFRGLYKDDAGNWLDVIAVANPGPQSGLLDENLGRDTAFRKGSGYGIVSIHKRKRTATFRLYRVGTTNSNPVLFPGFSKTLRLDDIKNGGQGRGEKVGRGRYYRSRKMIIEEEHDMFNAQLNNRTEPKML